VRRSIPGRALIIAVAVSCGSAALVPWGSEVAALNAPQGHPVPTVRPVASGPLSRAVTATGKDPLAVKAAAAYRALALARVLGGQVLQVGFTDLRRELAEGVGTRIGVDPTVLHASWSQASEDRQLALLAGLSQMGVPYRRLALRPGVGFDCSGLTSFAWSMVGENLPRSSRAQIRASERVAPSDVQPGDLAYYPGHVMMSLGIPGAVLHSPEPGRSVQVRLVPQKRSQRWVYANPVA
jgi:cell wall-associated NlpC family hydrolase